MGEINGYINKPDKTDTQTGTTEEILEEQAKEMSWENSHLQFSRLLAEINGVGLSDEQMQGLCEAMDLTEEQINELFDRANVLWEVEKSLILERKEVYVDCPECNNGPLIIEGFSNGRWNCACLNCEHERGKGVFIWDNGKISMADD